MTRVTVGLPAVAGLTVRLRIWLIVWAGLEESVTVTVTENDPEALGTQVTGLPVTPVQPAGSPV